MKKSGLIWMSFASFSFACMAICVKLATSTAAASQAVFFRAISGLPILAGLIIYYRIPILSSEHKPLLFIRSFFGFLSLALYFYAVSKIPVGNAAILNATAPIFVVFFSQKVLKEKIERWVYASLPLFFLGVYLIVKPAQSTDWLYHTMALISGVTSALAYMSVRRLGKTEHATTVVFYYTMFSLFGSIPLILWDWKPLTQNNVMLLVASGVFATVAQLAMTKAYKLEKASVVSLYGYLSPMFSYGFGLIFLHEFPDVASILGSGLILLTAGWIYKINKSSRIEFSQ